jgi:hypothetical protein
MNKITEIIKAWATAINPTAEQKLYAEIRLETCMECEHWQEALISTCKLCGCATKGKVFSPRGIQACPIGKWKI